MTLLAYPKRTVRYLLRTLNPAWESRAVDYHTLLEAPAGSERFQWRPIPRCPDARMDAGGVAMGDKLYVIGGYASLDQVLSVMDVLDMRLGRWVARVATPAAMAHSHAAVTSDGVRHIFVVSGQWGSQCKPATPRAFVFDIVTNEWRDLPPLPESRYASTVQVWRGRLHVLGGSRPDRSTPASEHWSLELTDGLRGAGAWREEVPIPKGGPHRASAIVDDRLYVFGGQLGDAVALAGSADCHCTDEGVVEHYYPDVFVLGPNEMQWRTAAPMPVPVSHTEGSIVVRDPKVYLFGGQQAISADDPTHAASSVVQCYDAHTDRWHIAGALPYRVKTPIVGAWGSSVFAVCGMRDVGPEDARARFIVNQSWRGQLP